MARRKRHEEHESHERWLVSYADFITLLFAFFTVLYATSQADVEKQEEFEKSIQQQFASIGIFGIGQGGQDGNLDQEVKSLMRPNGDVFPPMSASANEVQDHVERKLDKDARDGIKHDAVGVRIQVAASRLFPSGSAELKASSVSALDKIGALLKESNRQIIIEGHTDDEPIRTKLYPSNWELSAARATKIVRYLIARHDIPPSRLTAVAYADQKPVAPNTSETNRAKNRRIEVMIVTPKKTAP